MLKLTNAVREDLISEIIGEDIVPLLKLLKNKKNVSEFKLAETMNITVNQTRNMLYRLSNHNLVTFTRKKDKRKGWYIYYWTLDMKNIKEALLAFKRRKLEEFKSRLAKETQENHLVCPTGCSRMSMESAMENNFMCSECGQVMQEQNNKRTIDNLNARIKELEDELTGEVREYDNKKSSKELKKAKKVKKISSKKVRKILRKKLKRR